MGVFFLWIVFSFVVGLIGSNRTIGFWGAFVLSLLLSPLIGLVITLVSKNEEDEKYKQEVLKTQKAQKLALESLSKGEDNKSVISIADEIEKLQKLKEENVIDETEFVKLKEKLMNSSENL